MSDKTRNKIRAFIPTMLGVRMDRVTKVILVNLEHTMNTMLASKPHRPAASVSWWLVLKLFTTMSRFFLHVMLCSDWSLSQSKGTRDDIQGIQIGKPRSQRLLTWSKYSSIFDIQNHLQKSLHPNGKMQNQHKTQLLTYVQITHLPRKKLRKPHSQWLWNMVA